MKHSKIKLICEIIFWIILILGGLSLDRNYLLWAIKSELPSEQSKILVAMLWGDVSGVSKVFYNQMVQTGLIHILVVSGSNMMIVVKGLVELLSQWLGRKRSIIFGLVVGWLYTNTVLWQIPAVRAILMVSIMYLAQFLGRRNNVFRMLLLTVVVLVVADYRVLGSLSFWMSMLAFIAVVDSNNDGVIKTTFRVNLYLLPILAWKFGRLSVIAPISNLLTLFLVETITILGFLGIVIKPVLWLVFPLLVYIQKVVEVLSVFSFSQISVGFNSLMMAGCYFILSGYFVKKYV